MVEGSSRSSKDGSDGKGLQNIIDTDMPSDNSSEISRPEDNKSDSSSTDSCGKEVIISIVKIHILH